MAREKTKTEAIVDGLTKSYNMVEEKCRSKKYRMFKWISRDGSKTLYYFLGEKAALRYNSKPIITGSMVVPEASKLEIMKRGVAVS